MSPSAAEKSASSARSVVGDADLDIRLVGKALRRRAIHADVGEHAAREVVGAVDPHRGVGELHHRRLEMRGVVVGAGLVGGRGEAVDQTVGRVERGRSPRPTVRRLSCHAAPGRAGEHRRRDRRERTDTPRASTPATRGSGRASAARIAVEVGCAAGADARARRGSPVPRYDGWLSEPSGSAAATIRDCRPSAHSASSWSPESTTMRCGSARHHGVSPAAWRTVAVRRSPGSERRGFGRTRFVGPALIAEHARTGDSRRAGDDRLAA